MSDTVTLHFESRLQASRTELWQWITSVQGIRSEMRPLLTMTMPKGISSLAELTMAPGQRLFRSYILLFGFLPADYSDLTLLELRDGEGFTEQSPMGSMKLWRHERNILPCPDDSHTLLLSDRLVFQPRLAKRLSCWLVGQLFTHRHQVLRKHFGTTQPQNML